MSDLKQTALHDLHVELGAKMVPFAGYSMPVQYPLGVMKEHLHTRAAAGLFDVGHMGQVVVRAKSGSYEDAALAMERLVPVDVLGLGEMRQRYAMFTDPNGGILDDLMLANLGDHLFVVVNAGCKDDDIALMRANLSETCEVEVLEDRALLALQGPQAEAALARLQPSVADMKFMDVARDVDLDGIAVTLSRSGYTGEDGYEISVANGDAVALAQKLLAMEEVEPIGLGARDSLRLEGGLCLYGHDIDTTTTPVEAALNWAIQKVRREDGDRAGGFPGAGVILQQLADGAPRKRVGLLPEGRAPMREGVAIYDAAEGGNEVGRVTSGGFGPTVGGPVAMGYVSAEHAKVDTALWGEVRGKRLPLTVTKMPFVAANFKR
ncbi:glycine cleavage system aminomethyltransferase GcvT [Sulfitobacter sp. R18_1]|uniref:glycine cleavage system aminomethyltransferase GcvT n=1 Tax=Sulfitobacter sp. R18_1 TaxID=2821104 RepID=UPI001ADCD9C1|nr:glycine cleavage system aminomethyltransferase GcvT [Sulfitobacter sp. R18_1]MBO9429373.1 glycine cleavage system aminomethyltransferase GcvT [Sulfitobacter sp. R18_1]